MKKLHIKLPALLTATKIRAGSAKHNALSRYGKIKNHFRGGGFKGAIEAVLAVIIVLSFLSLVALIYYQVRPIRTADIKVPIATGQASYQAGEDVSGIFFGETFWTGEVRILREVFCKNYKGTIMPPDSNKDGDFFSTQTQPRKFEGDTIYIGNLPSDIPVGANCILRFTNVYISPTPFGDRRLEYEYYTQNFTIITPENSDIKDADNVQGQERQDQGLEGLTNPPRQQPTQQPNNSGGGAQAPTTQPQVQQQSQPSEPVEPPREECGINLLGVKLLCN